MESWQLRTLAALSEALGLILSIYLVLTAICNSSSRASDDLFWPSQAPGTRDTDRHTCRQHT